jgi:hypothetical protein
VNKAKFTGQITSFEDSLISFKYYKINPDQITDIYVDDKTKIWYILKYKYEKLFLLAGTGYLLLDVINSQTLNKETVVISGSLITAGFLARWIICDKIRIKGKRRLQILNLLPKG